MLDRFAAKDNNEKDQLSLKYIKVEEEDKTDKIVIYVMVTIEAGIDLEKGHSQEFIVAIELKVQAVGVQSQY